MSLPAVKEDSELGDLARELGLDPALLDKLKDEILEEKVKSTEQIAADLGVSLANAKRIIASPEMSQRLIVCFKRAMLAELDLYQVPFLMQAAKSEGFSMTTKRRLMRELRSILEPKKSGPSTTVNVQTNVMTPGQPGFVDQKIVEHSREDE